MTPPSLPQIKRRDYKGTLGSLKFPQKSIKKTLYLLIMFFEVLLHLLAHEFVTNVGSIEFYNMHDTETKHKMEIIKPLQLGSLFVPFIFVDFKMKPLLVAWVLIKFRNFYFSR